MEENKEKQPDELLAEEESVAAEQTAITAETAEMQETEESSNDETTDLEEAIDDDDDEELLFSVPFNINVDELYQFQIDMGKEQIEKNRKRSKIVSYVEVAMGLLYFGGIMMGKIPNGIFQYGLGIALIALGVYGMLYYQRFFYPSLRKSVTKQHAKVPYFQRENVLDFYDTKCVERTGDKSTPNHWHSILSVIESDSSYYLQLEKNRCLLLPKRCATPEVEPFLRDMCERFEKKWVKA